MEKRSVLDRPRNLEQDIYELMDEDPQESHRYFEKGFRRYIVEAFGSVKDLFASELWKRYVNYYRGKYEK